MSEEQRLLFETYKIHVELAERVAHLRENVNRLHSSMISGVVTAFVLLYRFAPDTAWAMPLLGIIIAISWIMSFRSVTARLSAKHTVLKELEVEIAAFSFLTKEEMEFGHGFWRRKYMALVMPVLFLLVCIVLIVFARVGQAEKVIGSG